MRPAAAALGSAAFFVAAPGTVAGLVPWWITRWQLPEGGAGPVAVAAGAVLLAAGAAALVAEFVRFAVRGRGTPAPVAPTEQLMVTGLYRYVRNPMYVAVTTCLAGQLLLFRSPALLLWTGAAVTAMALFVRLHEEPALLARYGEQYRRYRADVPGWLPRLRGAHPG